MPTTNRASKPLAILLTLATVALGGAAFGGAAFAAAPALLDFTFPSLELGSQDSPYRASTDLQGIRLPLVMVFKRPRASRAVETGH